MDEYVLYLEGRINHAKRRYNTMVEYKNSIGESEMNYHGGFTVGYWNGLLCGYISAWEEFTSKVWEDG